MNPYGAITLPIAWLGALLLLVHFLYDMHWQGSFVSNGKRNSNFILSVHAVTWALCVSVPLYLVGTLTWEQVFFLLWTHWLMDWSKCHRLPTNKQWPLILDQAVHIATLGAVLWAW